MKEHEDFHIEISEVEEKSIKRKPMPEGSRIIKWGQPREDTPAIFISQEAYATINQHVSSNMRQEVGGILVGDVYLSPDNNRHYLIIEVAIVAKFTEAGGAHVTFTHDTWEEIWHEMDQHFPEKRILGWYHSHPGMGVFFSGADMFVHSSFFSRFWQVALVCDPLKDTAGFLQWHGDKIKSSDGFYEILNPRQKQSSNMWQGTRIPPANIPITVPDLQMELARARWQASRAGRYLRISWIYACTVTIALIAIVALFYVSQGDAQQVNLSLENTVDDRMPNVGDLITYTITVTNTGPNNATGVVVEDKLPECVLYVSDTSLDTYNSTGNSGLWTVGRLDVCKSATLSITAKVTVAGTCNNTAQIFDCEQRDINSTPSDAIIDVPSVDLELTKNSPGIEGGSVTYNITVFNTGPDDATGVLVESKVPECMEYKSDTGDGVYNSSTGIWDVGAISAFDRKTLSITVTTTGTTTGTCNNTAQVFACEQHDIDSTPGNNISSEDDQVSWLE